MPLCFQDSWPERLRRGCEGDATSSRENWPPHTLQVQAMTLAETAFAAVCGFHFFDSSPPHSGQITYRQCTGKKRSRSLRLRLKARSSGELMVKESLRECQQESPVLDGLGCALPLTPAIADQACESTAEQGKGAGLGRGCDGAKQTVIFHVAGARNTGGEIQSVGTAARAHITENDVPESHVDKGIAVLVIQFPDEVPHGIESVDSAITEVSHQQVTAELAEAGRCPRHSPRRVQGAH